MNDNKQGYVAEAVIPLQTMNITEAFKDRKVRFDFGFNNGDGRQRNTHYMWNGTGSNFSTQDDWGMLIFN